MVEVSQSLQICFEGEHLRRTSLIALLVGTWLTVINHIDLVFTGSIDPGLYVAIVLNYLTPFVVANAGLLSRHAEN